MVGRRQVPRANVERITSHVAMQMATFAPTGRVFVPCVDGVSHDLAESARAEDIAAGAEEIADALLTLDGAR